MKVATSCVFVLLQFAEKEGFESIKERLEEENIDAPVSPIFQEYSVDGSERLTGVSTTTIMERKRCCSSDPKVPVPPVMATPVQLLSMWFQVMSALFMPFGECAELLNTKAVQPLLAPGMETAVRYVQKLSDDDLKDKVRCPYWSSDPLHQSADECCCTRRLPAEVHTDTIRSTYPGEMRGVVDIAR